MTSKASPACLNALLNSTALKEQFTSAKLYIFSGDVPPTAEEALDMGAVHTQLVVITVSGSGTGVTLGTPSGGIVPKNPSETWSGTNTFDGVDDGETELTPTFFRLCQGSDDGRGAANGSTGYRIQGTVGVSGDGAELTLGTDTLTAGNTQQINDYTIQLLA
jgi:hypothetical protein